MQPQDFRIPWVAWTTCFSMTHSTIFFVEMIPAGISKISMEAALNLTTGRDIPSRSFKIVTHTGWRRLVSLPRKRFDQGGKGRHLDMDQHCGTKMENQFGNM
jgi:hypothetical protein